MPTGGLNRPDGSPCTHHDAPPTQPPSEIEFEVIADAEPEEDGRDESLDVANEELDEVHLGFTLHTTRLRNLAFEQYDVLTLLSLNFTCQLSLVSCLKSLLNPLRFLSLRNRASKL